MAFRVGKIAVCGDIAEIFHQIRILESDAHAQRFVWYNNETQAIRTFVMRSMTIGISCAPCHRAMRRILLWSGCGVIAMLRSWH